jgi:hypothetical protein
MERTESMGVIDIDYQILTLVAVLLFAAVGFARGLLKEGITTVLMIALVVLTSMPELVGRIAEFWNTMLKLVQTVIQDAGQLDLAGMAAGVAEAPDIFAPGNPYNFLLWLLAFLIVLSYVGSRVAFKDQDLAPLSRILGGLAGAINGFIAISMGKEYVLGYFDNMTASQVSAASAIDAGSAPASGVSVAILDVPLTSFVESAGPLIAMMAGAVILVLILSSIFKGKKS